MFITKATGRWQPQRQIHADWTTQPQRYPRPSPDAEVVCTEPCRWQEAALGTGCSSQKAWCKQGPKPLRLRQRKEIVAAWDFPCPRGLLRPGWAAAPAGWWQEAAVSRQSGQAFGKRLSCVWRAERVWGRREGWGGMVSVSEIFSLGTSEMSFYPCVLPYSVITAFPCSPFAALPKKLVE